MGVSTVLSTQSETEYKSLIMSAFDTRYHDLITEQYLQKEHVIFPKATEITHKVNLS